MIRHFSIYFFGAVASLTIFLMQPQESRAQNPTIEMALKQDLDKFSLEKLKGRWVATVFEKNGKIKKGKREEAYFVPEEGASDGRLELHSHDRKWDILFFEAPEDGAVTAEYSYRPKASEMNDRIPLQAREQIEGKLEWRARLDMKGPEHSPFARITFYPGEVEWKFSEQTGDLVEVKVLGLGKPTRHYYRPDPILEISQKPTKRVEVISFRGPEARPEDGPITPQVFTMIQGQKIYPQAYLDERLYEKAGKSLSLTIKGLTSGETAEISLETRGVSENGEIRYAPSLARVSHPLGRALTLGSCGAGHDYYYPPMLNVRWLGSFFASEHMRNGEMKGTCISFDGQSGEIVEFNIGDNAHYRVQWFKRWEHLIFAQNRKVAERMRVTLENGGRSAKSDFRIEMIERYFKIMDLPELTLQNRMAITELYFGANPGSELGGAAFYYIPVPNPFAHPTPKGGLLFISDEQAKAAYADRSLNIKTLRDFNSGRGVRIYEATDEKRTGQLPRKAAAALFKKSEPGSIADLERILVDKAIQFSAAQLYTKLGDYLVKDGMRLVYGSYASMNPAGKLYTMFSGNDIFGNKLSDGQYWLNVADVALDFGMLGFSMYKAASPYRYYNTSGTGGRILNDSFSTADLTARGKKRIFRGRQRVSELAGDPVIAIRRKRSGKTQVLPRFQDLHNELPPSMRPSQQTQVLRRIDAADDLIHPSQAVATDVTVQVSPAGSSRRRPTQTILPDNPSAEFGGPARLVGQELEDFRALNPDQPDFAAANYVVWRETGKTLEEHQSRARMMLAMEGMSDGQPNMIPGALSYGVTRPVADGVFTHRLRLDGIEASVLPLANRLDLDEVRTAMQSRWTVEVKVAGNGRAPRRVYIEDITVDDYGLSGRVKFFDPARGQVVEMEAGQFMSTAKVDRQNRVNLYRGRSPHTDAADFKQSYKKRPEVQEALRDFGRSQQTRQFSGTPTPNRYYRLNADTGEVVFLGNQKNKGAINAIYELPDQPGRFARISQKNTGNNNQVLNDLYGRHVLSDPDINPDIIEPLTVHHSSIASRGQGGLQVVEIVDQYKGRLAADVIREQGGTMTNGQRLAYVAAVREINRKGVIWIDGHANNYSFIKQAGQDRWKIQIFDPGGMYPVKGANATARRQMAIAVQNDAFIAEDLIQDIASRNLADANVWQHQAFQQKHLDNIDFQSMRSNHADAPVFNADGGALPSSYWTALKQKGVRDLMRFDLDQIRAWQLRGTKP